MTGETIVAMTIISMLVALDLVLLRHIVRKEKLEKLK